MTKKLLSLGLTLLTAVASATALLVNHPDTAQAATNLLTNPSVESNTSGQPNGWLKDSWGTNSPTFNYQSNGQDGTHSVSVTVSGYQSGDAKWYFQPVNVSAGHTYVYSDFYQSTVPTYLVVQAENSTGNLSYFQVGNALAAKSAWTQASGSFTAPNGTVRLTVFHLINQNGTLQTDNFDLHEADQVTITGGVPNNSVEQASDVSGASPASWSNNTWGVNTPIFTYISGDGHTGTHSVKTQITSYTSGDAKWYYNPQPATPSTQYTFSDYYKSDIPSRVVVEVTNKDNTQSYIELKNAPAAGIWTNYTDTFTTPTTTASLTVFHLISAVGTLTTDDYTVTTFQNLGFNRALVTLTFDDGFASQYTTGEKTLKTYNFPATFYITTGFLNSTDSYYMTSAMVQTLKNTGNQIADHTITHPHLPTLSTSDLVTELHGSQIYLQNNFSVSANDFASPFGDVNDTVMAEVRTYFRSHRGVLPGYNYSNHFDIYNLKVQNIEVTTTTSQVKAWINQAAKEKSWLILVYHQVDNGGDQYSVKPASFSSQMSALKGSGLPVVTLDKALTEVLPQVK